MAGVDGKLYTMRNNSYRGSTWVESSTSQPERNVIFNAGNFNAIYGKSATNQPPAFTTKYLIKYIL